MNSSTSNAQTSTPLHATGTVLEDSPAYDEDDFAIGCECANPALQIDSWGIEFPQAAQQ